MSNEVKGFFQFHTFNASIAHWVWCKCKFISSVYYLTLQISSELLLEVDKGRKVVSLDFQTAQGINPICSTLRASLSRNIFRSGENLTSGPQFSWTGYTNWKSLNASSFCCFRDRNLLEEIDFGRTSEIFQILRNLRSELGSHGLFR